MKFIPPLEIASKIMTLIEETDKTLIIVSPYVNINNWDKMKKCLERAVKRGVIITFITRKNATNDLSPLIALNIKPILVKDLHAKLYVNDKYGIVSSQNITQYSDENSIDIGYLTQTSNEKIELIEFVEKYVSPINTVKKNIVQEVQSINYETKKQLNENEVTKIYYSFLSNFSKAKFNPTSSYVFCDYLLPYGDVMIDHRYTIKINKNNSTYSNTIKKIENINLTNCNTEFEILVLTTHKSYYYIEFIPKKTFIRIEKLIDDYIYLTKSILN